jgi:NTP pyrophosphatase (non-canonical NTP hydrolase)
MRSRMEDLLTEILNFRDARNWGQFHTLRNLVVSVGIEAGELMEIIQWKTEEEIELLRCRP